MGSPAAAVDESAMQRLMDGVDGLLIDAPKRVSIDDRQTLPMLLLATGPLMTLLTHPFAGSGVVTAVDLERNQLRYAFVSPRDHAGRPDLDDIPSGATGSRASSLDLRQLLGLPWKPAKYRIRAILRDWCSNEVDVELVRGPQIYRDPEVERFIAERSVRPAPREVGPLGARPAVSFGQTRESPQLTEDQCIAVAVERVVVAAARAHAWLHGSVRVPIPASDVVGAGSGDAVIGVWILAVGSDRARPVMVSLGVPATVLLESGVDGPIAAGHFQVDMLDVDGIGKTAQTWFIHVFAAGEKLGPVPMAVISPDALRG